MCLDKRLSNEKNEFGNCDGECEKCDQVDLCIAIIREFLNTDNYRGKGINWVGSQEG